MNTGPIVIHPACAEEPPSPDFTVAVNGQPVFVHQARVSAQPINQVWPGYQRPLEQTEMAAFAGWDMSGPVDVEVWSARPIREVRVRPAARGVQPSLRGRKIRFELDRPGPVTVEVNGMRRALHLFAHPPEDAAPDPKDPRVIAFGPGVHCPGLIRVNSGQTVYLAGGAVVYGSIAAEHAEDIVIRGRGILDGSKFSRGHVGALISLVGCNRVTIEGLTLRDPCGWCVVPVLCRDVHIRHISLIGLWRYNADGIDFVNSRHGSVEDCFVRSYDDCIVFKGLNGWGGAACNLQPVTDIRVRRCVLWNDWGRALEIGAETVTTEISDLEFDDCDIIHSLDVAMEVQNGDRGHCHGMLFRNIRVELDDDQTRPVYQTRRGEVYAETARHISQLIVLSIGGGIWSKDAIRGRTDGIGFRDIDVTAWSMPETYLSGHDAEHQVQDILIDNLRVNGQRIASMPEGRFTVKEFVRDVSIR